MKAWDLISRLQRLEPDAEVCVSLKSSGDDVRATENFDVEWIHGSMQAEVQCDASDFGLAHKSELEDVEMRYDKLKEDVRDLLNAINDKDDAKIKSAFKLFENEYSL